MYNPKVYSVFICMGLFTEMSLFTPLGQAENAMRQKTIFIQENVTVEIYHELLELGNSELKSRTQKCGI